jgi:ankyrin repeat protein
MLDEMYERILQEIPMAKWESAHLLFQCVAVASRPLHAEELAESLAFDFETEPIPKFHEGWRPESPLTAVLSICSTFLTTISVEDPLAIQFTHVSAKEFLTSARLAKKPDITSRRFHISLTLAHTHVAQVCLGILVHLDENITSDSLSKYPLAAYAAEHWDYHAKMGNVSRSVEDGIKVLLDPKKPHLAIWVWLYDAEALRSGTDWSERPIQPGGIPLHYAALCGLHTIVSSLVVERPQDVNARRFDDNSTPLHLASARGQMEAARVLLERGADVNARDHSNWTPLHEASRFGDSDTVHFLLEHGANVHAVDHGGWTPLHLSSYNGHLGVVLALVEHGIDVNARDNSNWTPLHGASQQGHLEVAQVLLEHGAGANFGDCRNQTPLHSASQRGHVEVAQVLLEHGGNGNSRDDGNETPMHLASRAGYLGLVRLLVEHGAAASVYVRNEKNHTPFQEASAKGHHDVMQLLLEYGTQEIEEAI